MSDREVYKFSMYDREIPDFDVFDSLDDEIIQISSPPIKIYSFNFKKTMGDKKQLSDELYGEVDIIDENKLDERNAGSEYIVNADIVSAGEIFDNPIEVHGYYQESTWTQELARMGISEPEELAITFNYGHMISKLKSPIKIGDIIQTFRGKIFRVQDAYISDETVGWKYIHFHVVCKKPEGLDTLILPKVGDIPRNSSGNLV